MVRTSHLPAVLVLAVCLLADVSAQQVVIGTPRQNIGDSFFENFGVGFQGRFRGGFFRGADPAPPPAFPGINPVGGGNLGFGLRGGGFGANVNVGALQGSSRTFDTIAPSVTIPNGGSGSIFSGSQSPFVTGIIPVVGGGHGFHIPRPYYPSGAPRVSYPLHGAIQQYYAGLGRGSNSAPSYSSSLLGSRPRTPAEKIEAKLGDARSTAASGDLSVAEIKHRRAARLAAEDAARNREIAALIERARGASEAGKAGVARVYLRQAHRRATGQLKRQIAEQLEAFR